MSSEKTFGNQELWSIAECFHTALRKCCDSSPTSAAWNIIYLVKNEDMAKYWTALRDALATVQRGKALLHIQDVIVPAVKHATNEFDWYGQNHALSALGCAFRCFDDNDWYGYCEFAEYLPEVKQAVKKATKKAAKKTNGKHNKC